MRETEEKENRKKEATTDRPGCAIKCNESIFFLLYADCAGWWPVLGYGSTSTRCGPRHVMDIYPLSPRDAVGILKSRTNGDDERRHSTRRYLEV